MQEEKEEDRKCKFCSFTAKSPNGLQNHIHRIHKLETPSGLECWTCGKQFTKQNLIDQHYKTVLHQINCKKSQFQQEESEMPPQTIQNIIQEHQEKRENKQKRSFQCIPIEKPGTSDIQKIKRRHEIPFQYLRTEPAIIPLERTMPQSDPRSEPIISWIDVTDLDLEESHTKMPSETAKIYPIESTHEQAFREEILNLFTIPKEDIPTTRSSQEMLEELPVINFSVHTESDEIENFSFLEYLQDQNSL